MPIAICVTCGERFPIANSHGRKQRSRAQLVMVELLQEFGFDHGEYVRESLPPALDACGYCEPRAPLDHWKGVPRTERTSCNHCGGPRTTRDSAYCLECQDLAKRGDISTEE